MPSSLLREGKTQLTELLALLPMLLDAVSRCVS